MIIPPKLFRDEQKKLLNEYFALYPDDEKPYYNVDEERLENARMKKWLYKHASELLQRYWDYRDWIGDDEVQNIIDVSILEDLNTGDLDVWKWLGDYLGEDFRHYINYELIHTNIVMRNVPI